VLTHIVGPHLPVGTGLNPSFPHLRNDPLGLLSQLCFTGSSPASALLVYTCVGIVVGRLRLSSARTASVLLVSGLGLAVAASAARSLVDPLGGSPITDAGIAAKIKSWWQLASAAPHSAGPLNVAQTIGLALALLGLMLLLAHQARPAARYSVLAWAAGGLLRPLAAAGCMTLTLYTAVIVYLNSPLHDSDTVTVYRWMVVLAVLFALGWRRAIGRGPLEGAVNSLAHTVINRTQSARRSWLGRGSRISEDDTLNTRDAKKVTHYYGLRAGLLAGSTLVLLSLAPLTIHHLRGFKPTAVTRPLISEKLPVLELPPTIAVKPPPLPLPPPSVGRSPIYRVPHRLAPVKPSKPAHSTSRTIAEAG
jgi:hypothetical protein